MKQPGPKSAKEEGPEQRKGPKRAVNGSLKVQTHVWDQDAAGSNPVTSTTGKFDTDLPVFRFLIFVNLNYCVFLRKNMQQMPGFPLYIEGLVPYFIQEVYL